ncbi:AAA family ATPase [Otariodibacter oris]|uniref:DNA transposition AAA+ family ATPase n=1 Tax=Otariodibacter oris TaxID=1032623 RepID=A0A420XIE2_9PAST|nr:AAA family ATPase [Otariodibacter oris]QGM80694.1 transcriptional regulator [Otariodibacter oris]RKR77144.1 DNA transposition AAA+ family ATPase [Otariodibacter oris]
MQNQQLKVFMESKGFNQKQVANLFGVSIATVSQYLSGKYQGNCEELDKKVDELMARYKAKVIEAKYDSSFVETSTAKRGMEIMDFAHVEGEINVIFGAAGLGKTQMLKQYAKTHSSAVLIEVDPSCTPKVLLRRIAEKVGVTAKGINSELLEGIVSKLTGSERLLMIDEAELLSTRSLEFVRRIHDLTGIGVVLAGMPRLLVNLKGKNNELAQLYSRVGFACDLGNALPDEDLGLLAKSALGTDEYNPPLIKASKGNARRLSKLMRGVVRSAEFNNMEISNELVEQYSKMLIS